MEDWNAQRHVEYLMKSEWLILKQNANHVLCVLKSDKYGSVLSIALLYFLSMSALVVIAKNPQENSL